MFWHLLLKIHKAIRCYFLGLKRSIYVFNSVYLALLSERYTKNKLIDKILRETFGSKNCSKFVEEPTPLVKPLQCNKLQRVFILPLTGSLNPIQYTIQNLYNLTILEKPSAPHFFSSVKNSLSRKFRKFRINAMHRILTDLSIPKLAFACESNMRDWYLRRLQASGNDLQSENGVHLVFLKSLNCIGFV